jgi:acyl carrier protein
VVPVEVVQTGDDDRTDLDNSVGVGYIPHGIYQGDFFLMEPLSTDTEKEIKDQVYEYFAEECDVDINDISGDTDIIEDLEGDSLMLLSLLELFRKRYGLTIELKTLGKHLMKKPANKVGQVVALTIKIVQYGNDIINVEL